MAELIPDPRLEGSATLSSSGWIELQESPGITMPSSISWYSPTDPATLARIAALEAHIASLEKVLDGQTATIIRLCELIDKMQEERAAK